MDQLKGNIHTGFIEAGVIIHNETLRESMNQTGGVNLRQRFHG